MEQESGFKLDALGFDQTGSYGLCQWLGPRKRALFEFAKNAGKPPSDPMVQTDFMLKELRTSEATAGRLLKQTTTPNDAALCFSRRFERPAKEYAHNDKRCQYAERFARQIEDKP